MPKAQGKDIINEFKEALNADKVMFGHRRNLQTGEQALQIHYWIDGNREIIERITPADQPHDAEAIAYEILKELANGQ